MESGERILERFLEYGFWDHLRIYLSGDLSVTTNYNGVTCKAWYKKKGGTYVHINSTTIVENTEYVKIQVYLKTDYKYVKDIRYEVWVYYNNDDDEGTSTTRRYTSEYLIGPYYDGDILGEYDYSQYMGDPNLWLENESGTGYN